MILGGFSRRKAAAFLTPTAKGALVSDRRRDKTHM